MAVSRAVLPSYNPRSSSIPEQRPHGTGVPYALGAKLAMPERPAVAVIGDYAFGAAAMEVETAARIGANVVFVISNNGGIAGHSIQDRMFAPDSAAHRRTGLLPVDYERMGRWSGFSARVTDPAEIRPTLERALNAGKVAVINVITDPKRRQPRVDVPGLTGDSRWGRWRGQERVQCPARSRARRQVDSALAPYPSFPMSSERVPRCRRGCGGRLSDRLTWPMSTAQSR
ncbi:thiamine pyrophosphate-dependent enzyme [Candidatus Amarobacter glycogenicus]|uniref:thiamine pyrophosphate-dependent enzyme n=1 Tax=Candidatus Amarobacter glycogenicus TaxID=3140699 RepID=UPI002A0F6A78|nr:hypothetical protein [Dehalococcoidia bacterium]